MLQRWPQLGLHVARHAQQRWRAVRCERSYDCENSRYSGVARHASAVNQSSVNLTNADGSTISADGVSIISGKDINVTGSSIVGTNSVGLAAQGNVNILAATDTYQDSEYHDVKHSGLSGSGGIGFSVGSSEQKDQYDANSVTQSQSRSTVGAVQGNVSISAGKDLHIGGSDIIANQAAGDTTGATGNIAIQAQNITIDPSQDTAQSRDQQSAHSSGITVGVTGTPLDRRRVWRSDDQLEYAEPDRCWMGIERNLAECIESNAVAS